MPRYLGKRQEGPDRQDCHPSPLPRGPGRGSPDLEGRGEGKQGPAWSGEGEKDRPKREGQLSETAVARTGELWVSRASVDTTGDHSRVSRASVDTTHHPRSEHLSPRFHWLCGRQTLQSSAELLIPTLCPQPRILPVSPA